MSRRDNPEGDELAPLWEVRAAWSLRTLLVLTAVAHVWTGQWLYALLCLLALTIILSPPVLARSSRFNMPVEIELVASLWFVSDMTIGRLLNMYESWVVYDKVIHFWNSGNFAILAFLAVYSLKMTCRMQGGAAITVASIFLATLGVGALWEIAEFAADAAFGGGAQGSPLQAPLEDTMWDLIVDGIGGLLGGILGAWYMRSSRRSLGRWRSFMSAIAAG